MSTLPKKNSRKPNPVTRLSTFQKWLMFLGMFVLIFTTLPAVIVIFIGLLPTITLVITDPKNTTKLIVIGCFNMSGVFFCIMSIIDQFNLREAFFIVGNIFNLVIMLGSAALGAILYYELPNIFIALSKLSAQKRLKAIDSKLEKLALDWGQDTIDSQKK